MRLFRAMVAGALALGGVLVMEGQASAQPISAPALTHVQPVGAEPASAGTAESCYYGWRRHYGWHRHYGYGRPWGWHRRYYGWRRPYGWHRHYGWRRRFY